MCVKSVQDPAEDCFGRVALSVVDEDASVDEFAPVFSSVASEMGVQSESQISGHGAVTLGSSRCSVGSVEAHAFSQLGLKSWMCGSV